MKKIYLDNNASTPLDPHVLKAMIENLEGCYGNPSSLHSFGQASRNLLVKAKQEIASFFGVKPNEIVFTSGATEGLNTLIKGVMELYPSGHIISSSVEHAAVHTVLNELEKKGHPVTRLPVGPEGNVSLDLLKEAIRENSKLVVLMAVNNETGAKTNIGKLARYLEKTDIPFLVDGVALLGKEPFYLHSGVSAICFSGHKIHGPKGVGFSIIRNSLKYKPLIIGGEQQNAKRGGTENLTGIIALAEAIRQIELQKGSFEKMKELRDLFEQSLMDIITDISINGTGDRIGNTTNLCFKGVDGESLLACLDMEGIAASHGSACSSGALEPSRVLINMGLSRADARSSIRFSFGRFNTEEEVRIAIPIIAGVVNRLRKI